MTDEKITIGELGAYTNNSMNREGLKKLVDKVNNGGSSGDAYTKAETDALLATKQGTLTAGANIAISEQNVISATDTKYTAGTNVAISEQNVISATDTKYTAGTGISISEQNVISATGGSSGEWTLRTPNDDWTDIFDVVGNALVFKKDTLIIDNTSKNCFMFPKDFTGIAATPITITCAYFAAYSTEFRINYEIEFDKNKITSSSATFKKTTHGIQMALDANNKLQQYYENGTVNKSGFIIYTKD